MLHRIACSVTSFDGVHIYYEKSFITPQKKYLVFLHGLGGDLAAWNTETKAFAYTGYTTITIDLRGHGLSDRPGKENSYDMMCFAKDVQAVLKKEHSTNYILIGHCFGGIVALTLEGLFPQSGKGLVLIDSGYKAPYFSKLVADYTLLKKFATLLASYLPTQKEKNHVNFAQFKGTGDFNVRRIFSDIMHTSLKSYLLISQHLISYDATSLLKKITVPTLIIEGAKDHIYPPYVAKDLVKRISHAQIRYIKDGNHIVVLNNPKDVVSDIQQFLKSIRF